MRLVRGDYPGASEFAHFDQSIYRMNEEELRSLLSAILNRASPGEENAAMLYRELQLAEENWKEQRTA